MSGSWWQRLRKTFEVVPDFDLGEIDFGEDSPPIATSFRPTGRLERASRIERVFSRFHARRWTFHDRDFHRNFEDSDRKWAQTDRYADANIQCGHFFGCTTRATEAEAKAYAMDRRQYHFLEVEMNLDGILDLTYEENLDWILGKVFANPEKLGTSYFTKLIEFIHHQKGGDKVNSFAGYIAQREGYDGIRFFGARALRQYETIWQMNPEDPMIFDVERIAFPDMRADLDLQNIVLFSGALAAQQVRRYRVDGGSWSANPYFGMPTADLDKVLRYPSAFQDERRKDYIIHRILLGDGPGEAVKFVER